MRVLQINSVFGVGSTGRICADIVGMLRKHGHEAFAAYGRKPISTDSSSIRIGSDFSVYSHVIQTRIFDRHGFGSKSATLQFLRWVDKNRPDIIHLHNIHGYYLHVLELFDYLKSSGIPVVWTLHDCWPFTGHCAYFDYVNCSKWQNQCRQCPQVRKYPSSLVYDNSRRNYERKKEIFSGVKNLRIATPSIWLSNLVKQSFLKEYETTVVNNGIDLDVFRPTLSSFREEHGLVNKFMLLGVANIWEDRKGFSVLHELSTLLSDDEHIVIVGTDERSLKGNRKPDNMTLIPRTRNARELAEIYSAADVYLNPTYEDNYPTTNLEALACETPIIAFDTGGNSEVIPGKPYGEIVTDKCSRGLHETIVKFRSAPKSEYAFGVAGNFAKQLDKSRLAQDYVRLYLKILTEG